MPKNRDEIVAEMMEKLTSQTNNAGYMCEVATPGCATKKVDAAELNVTDKR